MLVNIIGLTDRVLVLESLNIIIHGKKIAQHIKIESAAQQSEINQLKKINLIHVKCLDEENSSALKELDRVKNALPKIKMPPKVNRVEQKKETIEPKEIKETKEIEQIKATPKKRGRPKKEIVIVEDNTPIPERMGGEVTIGTGNGVIKKKMVRSIVPDSEQNIKFLPQEKPTAKMKAKEDSIFIEENQENQENSNDEDFLE